MKIKGKEIKILYVKFKPKETDRNRQEQTGINRIRKSNRNRRNRQDYISDMENYYNIKRNSNQM